MMAVWVYGNIAIVIDITPSPCHVRLVQQQWLLVEHPNKMIVTYTCIYLRSLRIYIWIGDEYALLILILFSFMYALRLSIISN